MSLGHVKLETCSVGIESWPASLEETLRTKTKIMCHCRKDEIQPRGVGIFYGASIFPSPLMNMQYMASGQSQAKKNKL